MMKLLCQAILNTGIASLLSLILTTTATANTPSIEKMRYTSGSIVTISGKNFGAKCGDCEVLVKYSRSLLYSAPVRRWSADRINIEIPDLNQRDTILQVQVKSKTGASNNKPLKLRRITNLSEKKKMNHSLNVGEKGEDRFSITSKALQCKSPSKVFDRASLRIVKKRFGDAKIITRPPAGCEVCSDVVVRWYNEPTGSISYELSIYKRLVQLPCQERIRH